MSPSYYCRSSYRKPAAFLHCSPPALNTAEPLPPQQLPAPGSPVRRQSLIHRSPPVPWPSPLLRSAAALLSAILLSKLLYSPQRSPGSPPQMPSGSGSRSPTPSAPHRRSEPQFYSSSSFLISISHQTGPVFPVPEPQASLSLRVLAQTLSDDLIRKHTCGYGSVQRINIPLHGDRCNHVALLPDESSNAVSFAADHQTDRSL